MNFNKDLTKPALPTTVPEFAVAEYLISKQNETLPRRQPEWDVPRNSPAVELVAARRDLSAAEIMLAEKRKEHLIKRKEMDNQWEDLRSKELALKESFSYFHKFVKKNQEKRKRAEMKLVEELALQERRDTMIAELAGKVKKLAAIKESIESQLQSYRIYEVFLERVVAGSKQYDNIQDVLNRYDTLMNARTSLSESQAKEQRMLDEIQREMSNLPKEKTEVLMRLNARLANLQERYSGAVENTARWEAVVARIKDTAAQKKLELGQVKSSCWNIYTQMCKRKGVQPKIDMDDQEHQLEYIAGNIAELKKVVELAKTLRGREVMSTRVNRSIGFKTSPK